MDETRLPPSILAKATLRGNEYAWPFEWVEEAISVAVTLQLVTLGGQAQFRLPDGICEMYWLNADAPDRRLAEPWSEFVSRSALVVLRRFEETVASADYVAEAHQWPFLQEKIKDGVNTLDYLCFVLYFQAEPGQT